MPQATMYNPTTGQRIAVESGSQQAQGLFGSGYFLETSYNPQTGASTYNNTPTTPTPVVPTNTQTSTPTPTPTASDIYAGISYETPEEKAFREAQGKSYLDEANSTVDEEKIRRDTLAKFQAEIDALTKVYEEKKRVERIAGEGRMGSVAAVGARRGLLGSDFGTAQENNQANENQNVINAIDEEKGAKIANIMAAARNMAQKEIDDKVTAKKLGAENYLKYISESSERKKTNVEAIVKKLYDSDSYDSADIKGIAESLGVSEETIKQVYGDYKKTADKAQADADKKTQKELDDRKVEMIKQGFGEIKDTDINTLTNKGYDVVKVGDNYYAKKPKLTSKTVKVGSTTYNVVTDESGNIVKKEVVGGSSSTKGSSSVPKANTNAEKTAITEMTGAMSQVAGSDGFISPDDYTELRKQWVDAGLSATTFDTKFKGYRNPNNPYYITTKQ